MKTESQPTQKPKQSNKKKNIEAIYPLSPLQQGLLFHSTLDPESGAYIEQLECIFSGELDTGNFHQAWQQTVDRHPVLRTGFFAKSLEKPVQIVSRQVTLPIETQDWRHLSIEEQNQQWENLLAEDRRRGFKLSVPPLMRLTLVCTAEDSFRFLWSHHHILLDGWSLPLVLKEVLLRYESLCEDHELRLQQPRPYREYIAWLQRQNLSAAEEYWRERLAGFSATTPLTVDRDLSAQPVGYAEETVFLSAESTTVLQTLAKQQQLTLNTLVQGAWALLLGKYSGEQDIVFGVTTSGRPTELNGVESMVGLFINTLPVRVKSAPDTRLPDWLKSLQAQNVTLRQYDYTPLVEVQRWSDVPGGKPLFESIFAFENYPLDSALREQKSGSFEIQSLTMHEQTNYPLGLAAVPGTELSLRIIYDQQRFDSATITRMSGHLSTLLKGMLANPQARLSELPLLTNTEQQQILVDWNATQTDFPHDQCIHQLFEAQVNQTPDASAVVFEDQSLTYAELNVRANQLAHHLRSLGVGPDVLVGICVERSLEMIVGLLGILKAGGAYVPLDPTYPQKRLVFMLEDSKVSVLVAQNTIVENLSVVVVNVICLDTDQDKIKAHSKKNPVNQTLPDQRAYVIYTSGSTGKPKGVQLHHRGLSNLATAQRNAFNIVNSDRVLQFASFSFDASVWECFMALTSGAALYLGTADQLTPGLELVEFIQERQISVATFPPSALNALPDKPFPTLNTIIVAGERCSSDLVTRWSSGRRFFNAYGPTESTVCATYSLCTTRDTEPTIGRPIANTQIYIIDTNLNPVPIGVAGEFHIGGIGLARGYLNRPGLTAEKFIPNPFSNTPGERLYKTGDLARYLPDGNIEFLGRIDHQVKIRGFRIELGEIEAILGQHPGVQEAVVVGRKDSPGNKRLVSYVVTTSGVEMEISDLRDFLKEKLPDYMIPATLVFLEALPLTPNGKVDRKALPAPEGRMELGQDYIAPRTPTEELLAEIWAEVLDIERIGIHDNFFDLGGHSLLATLVVSRIRDIFQIELPLRYLFEAPTIKDLTEFIESVRLESEAPQATSIKPVSRDEQLPLSFAQQRLWFLDQMEPNSPFYNIPVAVQLEGNLEVKALQSSFNGIIKRHEALRTTFRTEKGKAKQVILPTLTLDLPIIDLRDVPEFEQSEKIQQLMTMETRHSFNLSQGPLVRAKLLRLAEDDYLLQVTLHHIVADGWSLGVIIEELAALYQAFGEGQASPLPELPIQYADFAHWQRQWFQGEVLEKQLAYWKAQLVGLPPLLDLPTDRPRPSTQTYNGTHFPITVSSDLTQALHALSREAGTTLFMTLLAAFQVLLFRHSGQKDFAVGSPIANRNRREVEGLIGFFVNTLVLRAELADNPGFKHLLARIKDSTLGAYAHQDLPFERLIDELVPERDISHTPLFQVMFVLQTAHVRSLELPDLQLTPWQLDPGIAKFDLTLSLSEADGQLKGSFEYNTDLFDASTIARLSEHFVILTEGILQTPEARISELPLLSEVERNQLLVEWNPVSTIRPDEQPIHQLFEAQAEKTPDAIALIFEGQSITYAALNGSANQLAHHLRCLGIDSNILVAICVKRSLEMVVGLLGILKAGGAYVPLDPAHPKERLRFMLEDSEAPVLLMQTGLSEALSECIAEVIYLDRDWQKIGHQSKKNPANISRPEHLAYVIYTSGSTGKPKGTLVSHGNVTRLFSATLPWYQFNDSDVWALFHSYAFDFSVWELWGALLHGGRLVIVPYFVSRSPEDFYQLLCDYGVTVLNQTPMAFYQLSKVDEEQQSEHLSLRLIIFGGEALDIQRLKPWFLRHGDEQPQLVNMYGITETTVHVTYRPITMKDVACNLGSVIGQAIPDLQLYVLDEFLNPVPIGVPGELCVGGSGLAQGYLKRPELTEEKFIRNPFQEGERLYRSGDLARFLSDGDLEYLGRIDQQVKIRGFRIELGEIQARLEDHPDVSECLVIVVSDNTDQKRLAAYLVPQQRIRPLVEDLRSHLSLHLPDYMVPTFFEFLDNFPLTVNGKVDRGALPPPGEPNERDQIAILPRNSVEETLSRIWSNILGVDNISVTDNFFSLGGDSIRAIEVLSSAKEAGLSLSVHDIFRFQTLEALAGAARSTEKEDLSFEKTNPFDLVKPEDHNLIPEDVEDAYPLAALQAGMLFHSALNPESGMYHEVISYHLKAPFDAVVLQKTLEDQASRHPILRTSFELSAFSEPLQLVYRKVLIPIVTDDLRNLSEHGQQQIIEAWIEAEKSKSFVWNQPPMLRYRAHIRTESTFQLTLSVHHAILDGWSVASMLTELFTIYFSYINEKREPEHELAEVSYRDFVGVEKKTIQSKKIQHFWEQALRDVSIETVPRWPDDPNPELKEKSSLYDVLISKKNLSSLQKIAKQIGVPVRTVFLAAHLKVLAIFNPSNEALTGVVVNGRVEDKGGKDVLGLFLNTVPFHLKFEPAITWIDLIRKTYERDIEMLPYRRYPLAEIQKIRSGEPLFETAFNFVHFHVYQALNEISDLELIDGIFFERTNFPLVANFAQNPLSGLVQLQLRYDAGEFCADHIKVIGRYYTAALDTIARDPYSCHDAASLLTESEKQKILANWNATNVNYPTDRCLHHLFEVQVKKTPDSIAVVFKDQSLTYAELNAKANQLAHHLQTLGVGPDDPVGIYMERSLEMVIGLYGTLKAGGAYVPLDPDYPRERLSYILNETRVPVILAQNRLLSNLPLGNSRLLALDTDWQSIAQAPSNTPKNRTKPHDLAYVIYTSGSAGNPKGVAIPHSGIVNRLQWMQEAYKLDTTDRVLQKTPFSFDVSVWEFFWPLITGAQLVVAKPQGHKDAGYLTELIQKDKITTLHFVPSMLAAFLEQPGIESCSSLQRVFCSGEALPFEITQRYFSRLDVPLFNLYGPTEASVDVTHWTCENNPDLSVIPIGRPIANTQMFILDTQMNPLPLGAPGELHIGGIGLARGYLNRPDLTAEKFIPNPFSDSQGERLYKTGDLARYLADGNIEFLGRMDHQVKIRGFRIELGEIEAAMGKLTNVHETVVVAREDTPGDKRLVAYVVTTSDSELDLSTLRGFLKDKLPDYMVPAAFVFLDALPLTPNGKVDRKALPAPERRMELGQDYIAPRTPTEELLAEIWAEVLGIERVGIHDNFFDLGGHSLLVLRLNSLIEQRLGKANLPVATLFHNPTISQLASALIEPVKPMDWSPLVPINPKGSSQPLFCVPGGEGLALSLQSLAHHLGPDRSFYGLQAMGLDGKSVPISRVEDMATFYIEAIKTVQSKGPYMLAGYSFGGWVAFEMAHRLQAQGEEVSQLYLIDTTSPCDSDISGDDINDAELMTSIFRLLERLWDLDLSVNHDDLVNLESEQQVDYLNKKLENTEALHGYFSKAQLRGLLHVIKTNSRMRYLPQHMYPKGLTLFRASDSRSEDARNMEGLKHSSDSDLGWESWCEGSVDVQFVPGDHNTMMVEPNVQVFAEKLADLLRLASLGSSCIDKI